MLQHAYTLAGASMEKLSENGIFTEPFPSPLGEEGCMFKGAYIAGLSSLHENEPQGSFAEFLKKNADSVWEKARNGEGVITDLYQGGSTNANAASHAAGIDVLLAAALAFPALHEAPVKTIVAAVAIAVAAVEAAP